MSEIPGILTPMSPRSKLFAQALALSPADRIRLARELLESTEAIELSADDEAELLDRIRAIDRGGPTVAGNSLLATLRARLD